MFLAAGINSQPESWSDWPNRVIPIVNLRQDWRAQATFYATTALTVGINEEERVETTADILKAYSGVETHAWGHSNGTRVILDGWKAAGCPKLATVHLLCGACDSDFDANGINTGLIGGEIGNVFVYVADCDHAMRIENTFAGRTVFGLPPSHAPLGLAGPKNVAPAVQDRVHLFAWTGYDHSTCWDANHFGSTITQVMTLAEMYAPKIAHT